jgi:hypothetical protein
VILTFNEQGYLSANPKPSTPGIHAEFQVCSGVINMQEYLSAYIHSSSIRPAHPIGAATIINSWEKRVCALGVVASLTDQRRDPVTASRWFVYIAVIPGRIYLQLTKQCLAVTVCIPSPYCRQIALRHILLLKNLRRTLIPTALTT